MKKEEVFREEIPRPYSSFINELEEHIKKLNEKIRFLEQCLDNKEKVNKSMRNEIRNLKKELGKITIHSNMLESENKLFKEELKARLERIKELEK